MRFLAVFGWAPTRELRVRRQRSWSMLIGSERIRRPVAWYTALAMAADTPTIPISPRPLVPMGLNLGVVAQPQLERVDTQCVGHLVERRLEREVAFDRARAAQPTRDRNVEPHQPVVRRDVRTGIGCARFQAGGLDLGGLRRARRGALVIDRNQPALPGDTKPH